MSKLAKVLQAAAGNTPAGDLAAAIDFDGTNDYLSRSSDMTGNTDGKELTVSAWFYVEDETYNQQIAYQSTDGSNVGLAFYLDSGTGTRVTGFVRAFNSSGTKIAQTVSFAAAQKGWNHAIASINLAATTGSIYLNDELVGGMSTAINDTIDFTKSTHEIGASSASSDFLKGRLSNVFLDYTYRDLSVTNNRRLFITEDGKPADGQAGLSPIMYMPLDDPEDIGYNAGTGGDFTVNGVMARSGRGPNQYNAAASTFDGGATSSGDWMGRVLNATDSKTMSLSAKFKVNSAETSGTMFCLSDPAVGTKVVLEYNTSFGIKLTARSSSGTVIAQIAYADISKARWYQVDISVDMASTSTRHFLINGVSVGTWTTYTNDTIDFSKDAVVGQQYNSTSGASPFAGDLSDVYFTPAYIDLSSNNPFYDTDTNKPKYLGESGELPTGSSPLVYLPLRGNDAGNNLGTGGDFTVNSGPFTGARGPSEFIGRSATFADNKSLERSSLGTLSDGKVFYIAFAVKPSVSTDNNTGNIIYFADSATNDNFIIRKTETQDNLELVVYNGTTATDVNRYASNNNALSSGAWHTVLFTDDLSVTNKSKRELWINGTKINSWTENVNSDLNIPFSSFDRFRVSNSSFSAGIQGSIGFLAFDTTYLDFSQEANRLKFFDAFGYPVDLGEDGSTPTGSQPLIYINNDFHLGTNLGSGGDFTPTNTPTAGPDVGS